MEQPILQTVHLLLRPFTLSDAADVQRLAGAGEVADMTLNVPHPYQDGMAEQWVGGHSERLASGSLITYAIALQENEMLTGAVGLTVTPMNRRAELGYWLGVPYWNQGYMTEAASALINYGFTGMGLHKITASHFARNPASGRVMQKIGMVQEGLLRQDARKGDGFEDIVIYGLLAAEWLGGTRA